MRTFQRDLRVLWLVAAGCVVLAPILALALPDERVTMVGACGTFLVFILLIIWHARRDRLEISPDGVAYTRSGRTVRRADWQDIVGYRRGTSDRSGDWLVVRGAVPLTRAPLRQDSTSTVGVVGSFLADVSDVTSDVFDSARMADQARAADARLADAPFEAKGIPVGVFDASWHSGEIGALVRQYAPVAFDTEVE